MLSQFVRLKQKSNTIDFFSLGGLDSMGAVDASALMLFKVVGAKIHSFLAS